MPEQRPQTAAAVLGHGSNGNNGKNNNGNGKKISNATAVARARRLASQALNKSPEKPQSPPEQQTILTTYPYSVVEGLPTFETDYSLLGPDSSAKRAQTADPKMKRRKHHHPDDLPCKKLADGTIVPRPPPSRSTSIGDLGDIVLGGNNFKEPSALQLRNFKRGIRLSKCYDNVTTYGSRDWSTCNSMYGSVSKPSQLKAKRMGLISFELLRFLPNHPHWKDRPYHPGQYIRCPKSTYADLGSYYVDGYRLPPEYQYTMSRSRKLNNSSHYHSNYRNPSPTIAM